MSRLSTYDFSTLKSRKENPQKLTQLSSRSHPYYFAPQSFKDKLVNLIERTFQREGSLYIACNYKNAVFTSDAVRNYSSWSCQKVCEALTFLLDNIYLRFGSKLYRQIVGIPMGTNYAPLVADLFVPRRKSKGAIVMGSSVRPSVRPSVDTILSPQLLLQFSRDFDETFQLLFPRPENSHVLSRSCSSDFYQSYGPLTIFQQ